MPSKIAVLYHDEQSLQYFFVCHFCDACYETRSEIIAHVNGRCHKNVIGKIDNEPTIQSERPCCYDGKNENVTTTEADLNLNLIEDKSTVECLKCESTVECLKCETNSLNEVIEYITSNGITVDKSDVEPCVELCAKPAIIEILDSDGEIVQVAQQERIKNSSISRRDSAIIDISDDEVIAKLEIPATTNIFDETIEKSTTEELLTILPSGHREDDQSNQM